ncbi:uncharacterized protein A1O5_02011 [Cladophialophora psammophila CBS 110553]|uniref:Uncharacterized protein n=1 Tax=Cladophialophora psammophila CBS 110553 TaxID=1182543 RepID=W9XD94_9EURO|nr:uncharacterized protein A1O5_02011 [Cladophialophora psammophila CBS 110553]EXJ75315.1 hypothetical protein A1O5_02011 [Cladophialophora psammophila CBS 110553]
MDRDDILKILALGTENERPQTTTLRQQALALISSTPSGEDHDHVDDLPGRLLDLLTQIIKPLFTSTKHPQLTSTGRKSLVPGPPPSIATARFLVPLDDDEQEETQKPWKRTPFTVPLLKYVLKSYPLLPASRRKSTLESHFHLLVPPILNMIDDASPQYKSEGCLLLHLLCTTLISVQGDILRRTGLAEVFVDALKTNFLLLPTLTPEEDSLLVLTELYPAYLALLDARFIKLQVAVAEGVDIATGKKVDAGATWSMGEDFMAKEALLTKLYRHGIIASLSHLSSSTDSFSNTISAQITTFLLEQIPPVFQRMGIHAAKHLQTLLPMMRMGLMDPFVLAAPEMALAMLDVLDVVVETCKPRVKDKWWTEILRGCVACWCNCLDEGQGTTSETVATPLQEQMKRVKALVKTLGDVLGKEEWEGVKRQLLEEERDLNGLFED